MKFIVVILIIVFLHSLYYWMFIDIGQYTPDQWCNAIKHEEGAIYGVGNYHNQRQVCINTIHHKLEDWRNNYTLSQTVPFITYLSTKYCPYNSQSWERNIRYWLNKGE